MSHMSDDNLTSYEASQQAAADEAAAQKALVAEQAANDWKEVHGVGTVIDIAESYFKKSQIAIDKYDCISEVFQEGKQKIQRWENTISLRTEKLKIKFSHEMKKVEKKFSHEMKEVEKKFIHEIEEMKIELFEEIESLKKGMEFRETSLLVSKNTWMEKAELLAKTATVVQQIANEFMLSARAIVTDIEVIKLLPIAPVPDFKLVISKNSFESLSDDEKNIFNFVAVSKNYRLICENLDDDEIDASSKDKLLALEAQKKKSISKQVAILEASARESSHIKQAKGSVSKEGAEGAMKASSSRRFKFLKFQRKWRL